MLPPTVAGTVLISVNLEDRLGDVGTDYRDYLRGQLTNRGSLNSAHIRGTLGPGEEPSTASYPDTFTAAFWPSMKIDQLSVEIADADVTDLARSDGLIEQADMLGERHAVVRPVQQQTED